VVGRGDGNEWRGYRTLNAGWWGGSSHGDWSGNREHGLGGRCDNGGTDGNHLSLSIPGEEYATQRGSEAKNISDGGELWAGGTWYVHLQWEGPSYMHHVHIRGLGVRPHPPSVGSGRTPQGAKETGSRLTSGPSTGGQSVASGTRLGVE